MLASWERRLQSWVAAPSDGERGRRQTRLLGYLLLACLAALLVLTLINATDALVSEPSTRAGYLIQDAAACLLFFAIWALYRRGHVRLAGYSFIAAIVAGSFIFSLPDLDRAMILYAVPVAASSFLLAPAATFVIAALATAAYTVIYAAASTSSVYNYLSVLCVWLLAGVSWLVSVRSARHLAERDGALAHLRLEEARLASLYDIARYQARDTTDLLEHALDEAIRLTSSRIGSIYLYEEETRKFTRTISSKEAVSACNIVEEQPNANLDETGLWAEPVLQRMPIITNDYQAPDPRKSGYPPGHPEIRRFLSIPVFADGSIVAVVGVANKETDYDTDDERQLTLLMDAVWPALERERSRQALHDSEERYRTLFTTILEGFALHEIICDEQGRPVDYRFLDVNPAFERLTGLCRGDLVGKTVRQVLPKTEDDWIHTYGRVALTGEAISYENYAQALDRHYAVSAFSPRRGQFAVVFSDVTEARRAQDALQASVAEKDLLLREIHHRVKNNLQVIASLLNLQLDGRTDPTLVQAMRDSQNRIRSMALIHTKLYESQDLSNVDFGGFVRDLSRILSHSFGAASRGISFQVDAGTLALGVDTVIPCSLIINELVTNSLRHAFPPGQRGLITISMQPDAGDYVLRVTDDGPGLPADLDIRETQSLGLRLVTLLTQQLNGTVSLEAGPGACFVVRFPRYEPRAATSRTAVELSEAP